MQTNEIQRLLEAKGIKPSFQRIRLYQHIDENRTHQSADEIFQSLKEEIPTLSKTTVYNTMNIFEEHGLIRRITLEDNEIRYDVDIHAHGHFKCKSCGHIYDVELKEASLLKANIGDFLVEDVVINFKGICPDCRQKQN